MKKVFFIGAGKMASAIVGGAIRSGNFAKADFVASEISSDSAREFMRVTGVSCIMENIDEEIDKADCVVLAIKPQCIEEVLGKVKPFLKKNQLLISILAGVKIDDIIELSGLNKVIRIMPNTPALVGEGVSAIANSSEVTAQELEFAKKLFGSVGLVEFIEEKLLDAVTGLSGSGPAYAFSFIQALADGGVTAGLPRATATKFAAQTLLGAAKMVLESGMHPTILKDQVTSPGGTTARGLAKLEENRFNFACIEAVCASAKRSAELSKGDKK